MSLWGKLGEVVGSVGDVDKVVEKDEVRQVDEEEGEKHREEEDGGARSRVCRAAIWTTRLWRRHRVRR